MGTKLRISKLSSQLKGLFQWKGEYHTTYMSEKQNMLSGMWNITLLIIRGYQTLLKSVGQITTPGDETTINLDPEYRATVFILWSPT